MSAGSTSHEALAGASRPATADDPIAWASYWEACAQSWRRALGGNE